MLHRRLLAASLLALPAAPQASRPATVPTTVLTTVLSVRFAHPMGAGVLGALAPEGIEQAMAMEPGQFASFTLDSKLRPSKVTIAKGEAPAFDATLDPPALFAAVPPEDLANWRKRFEGVVKLTLSAAGVDNKEATGIATALWDFHKQIATVSLVVRVDREAPVPGDAVLKFTPVVGTPFANALKSLQPLPGGAPVLDRGGAFVTARSSLSIAPLDPFAQALARWSATLLVKDDDARAKMVEFSTKTLALLSGEMAMTWAKGGMTMVYASRDPKALAEFAASDLFGAQYKYMEETGVIESSQYEPKAFVHRDITVARGEQTLKKNAATAANPMFPADGVMRQYLAAAKEWMVSGTTEAETKQLIDAALDGKLKRVPLTEGNFAEFDFDTAILAAQMQGQGVPFERGRMTIGIQDKAIRLGISWQ
jgi:hypothetical protein